MEQSNNAPTETRLSIRNGNEESQEGIEFSIPGQRPGLWDMLFAATCIIGFLIDPMFVYMWSIDDHNKCVRTDDTLRIIFLFLRSVVDIFYLLAYLRTFIIPTHACNNTRLYVFRHLSRFIWAAILFIPYPQVPLTLKTLDSFSAFWVLLPLIGLQYAARVGYIYVWVEHIDINYRRGRFIKGVVLFIPFILTSHLFGAVWYYLAIKKERNCWAKVCDGDKGFDFGDTCDFSCTSNVSANITNIVTVLNTFCPTNPSNAKVLNFGIYLNVIESGMSREANIAPKLVQCFWWGLRNLSSFGSNLPPSPNVWENVFGISISISGIILFLIYLNKTLEVMHNIRTHNE